MSLISTHKFPEVEISFISSCDYIPQDCNYLIYDRTMNLKLFKIKLIKELLNQKITKNKDLIIVIKNFYWHLNVQQFMNLGFNKFAILPWFNPNKSRRICIVSYEKKIIFVPNYKVMYSSVREFMRSNFSEFYASPKVSHGLNSSINLSNPRFDDFFKFSIVRNPWDRFASFFRDKIGRGKTNQENYNIWIKPICKILKKDNITFEDAIKFISIVPDSHSDNHYLSQKAKLYLDRKMLVDYVGKIETLADSLEYISEKCQFRFDLPVNNPTKKGDYDFMKYYKNPEINESIKLRYKDDIEYFDYN